jgi:hypothetical protein
MVEQYYLGTALKFNIITNTSTADSVSIQIKNNSNQIVQDFLAATKIGSKVYEFIYQSSTSDFDGEYTAVVKLIEGIHTSIEHIKFTLVGD